MKVRPISPGPTIPTANGTIPRCAAIVLPRQSIRAGTAIGKHQARFPGFCELVSGGNLLDSVPAARYLRLLYDVDLDEVKV